MSHTYAVMEVSAKTYAEIAALLREAGYDHVFHVEAQLTGENAELIDMHGIALKAVEHVHISEEAKDEELAALRRKVEELTAALEMSDRYPKDGL